MNNNTIVVVNSVGPIIVDAWIENPNGTLSLFLGGTNLLTSMLCSNGSGMVVLCLYYCLLPDWRITARCGPGSQGKKQETRLSMFSTET